MQRALEQGKSHISELDDHGDRQAESLHLFKLWLTADMDFSRNELCRNN
jgi:hypothetical protein